jgi:hypothetical protein
VAQHQHVALAGWQALDLFIQDPAQLAQAGTQDRIDRLGRGQGGLFRSAQAAFVLLAADALVFQAQRQAAGDGVQPAAHRGVFADGAGLARQHQEGGLKGVVLVRPGAEDAPADAVDQGAVTPDQRFERPFVARLGEALQELAVAQVVALAGGEDAQVLQNRGEGDGGHDWRPRDGLLPT